MHCDFGKRQGSGLRRMEAGALRQVAGPSDVPQRSGIEFWRFLGTSRMLLITRW